jgi:hypothetical protein
MGVILTSILVLAFVIMEAVADRQQYTFQTENYRLKKHDDEYADGFKQSGLFAIVRKPNYDCRASNVEEFFSSSIPLGLVELVCYRNYSTRFALSTSGCLPKKIQIKV